MPVTLGSVGTVGEAATSKMFGGNILADRGDLTGDGSYQEAIAEMGVTDLRYPGGSLTEYNFDIGNPDATTTIDGRDGEVKDFIPLSEMMAFAESGGHAITIVVPTQKNLSESVDANGDRYTDIDANELREFVHDVMTGVYGDAEIAAFEIGNEYWGSGKMNATEYGRVSSEMTKIISDELDLVSSAYGIDTSGTDVVFQMGTNYSYSNLRPEYEGMTGEEVIADLQARYPEADIDGRFVWAGGGVDFAGINNQLLQAEFDQEEIEAADGIVAHVYSRGDANPGLRTFDLRVIEKNWLDEPGFEDLKIYVTEWNLASTRTLDKDEDYGLHQAHDMLNIVEEFMAYGVDAAHVWPLIQNTSNPLASGMDFSELGVPGEMFSMMVETLPGKKMIDFSAESRETELHTEGVDIHGFGGEDELALYIASNVRANSEETETTEIDISGLIESYGSVDITVLGVQEGELPGGHRAEPEVRDLDPEEVIEDGFIIATLAPGEIMQVVFTNPVPTEEFADTWATVNGDDLPEVPVLPDTPDEPDVDTPITPDAPDTPDEPDFPIPLLPPTPEEPVEDPDEESADRSSDDDDDSSLLGDIGWALMLLPLLAVAGLAA
jgi:hypothetical protein